MSESTIQHLFRSLEHTVRERLDCIQEVLQSRPSIPVAPQPQVTGTNTTYVPCQDTNMLLQKIQSLESANHALLMMIHGVKNELASLRVSMDTAQTILPLRPIDGIEVIPKREISIPETETEPLSAADRLLLNKKARKALEAEEMGEVRTDSYPLSMEIQEDTEEEVDAGMDVEEAEAQAQVEEAEAEADAEAEEEAEEAQEAEELEEFEYKGSTYYRDSENNVFMTDSDGELVDQPIGTWNSLKLRIIMTKTA